MRIRLWVESACEKSRRRRPSIRARLRSAEARRVIEARSSDDSDRLDV